MKCFVSFLFFICLFSSTLAQKKIIIEVSISGTDTASKLSLRYFPFHTVDLIDEAKDVTPRIFGERMRWELSSDTAVFIISKDLFGSAYFLAEPGDSLTIQLNNNIPTFNGKGAEKVLMQLAVQKMAATGLENWRVKTVSEYRSYSMLCDSLIKACSNYLKSFKERISPLAYSHFSASKLFDLAAYRLNAFDHLRANADQRDLTSLFDSTIEYMPSDLMVINDTTVQGIGGVFFYMRLYAPLAFARKHQFSTTLYDGDRQDYYRALYWFAKERFKGESQQVYLSFVIRKYLLGNEGASPEVWAIINDYTSTEGYPQYKLWVQKLAQKTSSLSAGKYAPRFSFEGVEGDQVDNASLKGKTVIMDFWFTGCVGCVQMAKTLKKFEEKYKSDTNVVFLSISVDEGRTRWLNSIQQGKYTTKTARHVYTRGQGTADPAIGHFNIRSYPELFVVDPFGRMAAYPAPDPRSNNGKDFAALIDKLSLENVDGPYVLYDERGYPTIKNIPSSQEPNNLKVGTDIPGKTFTVRLKKRLENEPSVYKSAPKTVVISDIEGNFAAFRRLLQVTGVIDSVYNWSYGNGHLVLLGDFFDRGSQVTETLWLIYKLEQEAKDKGGYVHFILGNHEIMNLQGQLNYVEPKYFSSATSLNVPYSQLWGRDSELGRWLRTKNIMERIGSYLYVHGGISPELDSLSLSIEQVNKIARPYYDKPMASSSNDTVSLLFHGNKSPFWYRGYYSNSASKKTSAAVVTSSLNKYSVKCIITGHSINKSGHIDTYYNNNVINVDVHHAKGESECLLIEGNKWYRIDQSGRRSLISRSSGNTQ